MIQFQSSQEWYEHVVRQKVIIFLFVFKKVHFEGLA